MRKKSQNTVKIERELSDLEALLLTLPSNPVDWVLVVKLVAPFIARLAVRYALKKTKRGMSEEKVNTIGEAVGNFIAGIIAKRTAGEV